MTNVVLHHGLLPGLPIEDILGCYAATPGNEIGRGSFLSPESSAALAANTFGFFLNRPDCLPAFPADEDLGWPPLMVSLETELRFPWNGGRHPWLDVVIETEGCVVGIESKRYEPFRGKPKPEMSEAFWRDVWGKNMLGYTSVRDDLRLRTLDFRWLDASQLVKHALGLRSSAQPRRRYSGKRPILVYLHAEPEAWPDRRAVPSVDLAGHRKEIELFAERVAGDEVGFVPIPYRRLLNSWLTAKNGAVRDHAAAVAQAFAPL